jgi:type II secretory pathway pseudopilin PulG
MRATQTNQRIAFTLIELLVMIVTLVMLGVLLFAGVPRVRNEARLKQCVNNLKQVGLAFRIWNSVGDRFQMQMLSSEGGVQEYVLNGEVFRAFQVMSNELGFNASLLICPADNRLAALSFTNGFSNDHVSYFVGVDATDTEPSLFLSGDRHLTNGPLPSTRLLTLTTNSTPGWTEALHNLVGNVALADGSVQTFETPQLQIATRVMGGTVTRNRLAFP